MDDETEYQRLQELSGHQSLGEAIFNDPHDDEFKQYALGPFGVNIGGEQDAS